MTGTLQPCSPCVSYFYAGFGGSISGHGSPVAVPDDTSLNWKYTDLNCGMIWYWSVLRQTWGC